METGGGALFRAFEGRKVVVRQELGWMERRCKPSVRLVCLTILFERARNRGFICPRGKAPLRDLGYDDRKVAYSWSLGNLAHIRLPYKVA